MLDGSDIDLESMAPEAVAAWVRKYPEQAWRKAYETAAYMIATGQVQLPQGNAPEPTPEPGEGNTNKPWESPEVSKTYYRTNEQGVQEPIYVPPVESQLQFDADKYYQAQLKVMAEKYETDNHISIADHGLLRNHLYI